MENMNATDLLSNDKIFNINGCHLIFLVCNLDSFLFRQSKKEYKSLIIFQRAFSASRNKKKTRKLSKIRTLDILIKLIFLLSKFTRIEYFILLLDNGRTFLSFYFFLKEIRFVKEHAQQDGKSVFCGSILKEKVGCMQKK